MEQDSFVCQVFNSLFTVFSSLPATGTHKSGNRIESPDIIQHRKPDPLYEPGNLALVKLYR